MLKFEKTFAQLNNICIFVQHLNKNKMKDKIFNKTIAAAKFDVCNGITNFFFSCKHQKYEILFGNNENEKVLVEGFGVIKDGKWIQLDPTESQMSVMQKMIDDKIANFPRDNQESIDPDFKGSYYDYYGVSPLNFY